MNLPIVPGQSANGKNAIKVVAVEEITGQAISPIPILEACIRVMPFSYWQRHYQPRQFHRPQAALAPSLAQIAPWYLEFSKSCQQGKRNHHR